MAFEGLQVLSLESRRAAEIELLIRKQGGVPFVAPSVKERALAGDSDAFRLLERLESGSCDLLILMTGVGLTFWRDVISAQYSAERADEALRRVKLLVRGPKPTAALRASGIVPDITVPEPNTWREIIEKLVSTSQDEQHRIGFSRVAVQEYGRPNPEFLEALRSIGADVESFALYRWELPDDVGPLREAMNRLARRQVDTILFTSGVQLEHLFKVAAEQNLESEVKSALLKHVAIASIGPIMNEALAEHGIEPDIVPSSPKMGPLVYAAADRSAEVLRRKRS